MAWFDLTVKDAPRIRDFYAQVIGWQANPVSMGEYDDYMMQTQPDGKDIAGVCHDRGVNADLPPYWLLYFYVDNLDESIKQVIEHGGEQASSIKSFGDSRYVVIKDPAGAFCALFQE